MIAGGRRQSGVSRKTLDEHKEYVEQLCRISFFYARWLKERLPGERTGIILRNRTPLFYHALGFKEHVESGENPYCLEVENQADSMGHLASLELEEKLYGKIKNKAMERADEFYRCSVGMGVPPDWNVRSLKYDPPKTNCPSNWCNFHIANWMAPRSFFEDPRHLPECFLELMEKSEKEFGYDTLHTTTWLNDNARWLALFPEEWSANLSPRRKLPGWSFGDWGQMATARGTFNYSAGNHLRARGELKYKSRGSHCSFGSMRKHLNELLNRLAGP